MAPRARVPSSRATEASNAKVIDASAVEVKSLMDVVICTLLGLYYRFKALFETRDQTISVASAGSYAADPDAPSVFVDLDGTLLRTEMGHTVIAFVRGLPHPHQRYWKTFLIPFVGILTKLASFFSEGLAIEILAITAIRSCTVEDVAISARTNVRASLSKVVRPDILQEIKNHQATGRKVAILTGSLEPLVKPFCESLGCVCIGTIPEVDPTGTYYTGHLAAHPNISTRKVHHVVSTGHALNQLYGYGNSKNDIPFLSKTGNPFVVNADKKLRLHASQNGWNSTFAVASNH